MHDWNYTVVLRRNSGAVFMIDSINMLWHRNAWRKFRCLTRESSKWRECYMHA